jgi:hypothetical protein
LRDAQQPSLHAYFVRCALEAKPFTRAALQVNPSAGDMFRQNLVILFHEAAHALPSDSSVRLSHAATILASGLTNDPILGMTGQLSGLLESDSFGQRTEQDIGISRSGEPPRTIRILPMTLSTKPTPTSAPIRAF